MNLKKKLFLQYFFRRNDLTLISYLFLYNILPNKKFIQYKCIILRSKNTRASFFCCLKKAKLSWFFKIMKRHHTPLCRQYVINTKECNINERQIARLWTFPIIFFILQYWKYYYLEVLGYIIMHWQLYMCLKSQFIYLFIFYPSNIENILTNIIK